MHAYRSHTCVALRPANVGETVRLSGWVHRKRDHGQLLFIDLRDHYGITQVVLDSDARDFRLAESLRAESVITVTGQVVARSAETANANLPTGGIEVRVDDLVLQSAADELPLPPGWAEKTSRSTGSVYFWNSTTGETTFVRPAGAA